MSLDDTKAVVAMALLTSFIVGASAACTSSGTSADNGSSGGTSDAARSNDGAADSRSADEDAATDAGSDTDGGTSGADSITDGATDTHSADGDAATDGLGQYFEITESYVDFAPTRSTVITVSSHCTQTFGSCEYRELPCAADGMSSGGPEATPLPNSGNITFQFGDRTLMATPGADGIYKRLLIDPELVGGEAIHIHGSGATIAPFDVSLTYPTLATITNLKAYGDIDVHSAMPLEWTGGSGQLSVTLATTTPKEIVCTFDSASGHGEIPAGALEKLPSGLVGLFIQTSRQTSVLAKDAPIAVSVILDSRFSDPKAERGLIHMSIP